MLTDLMGWSVALAETVAAARVAPWMIALALAALTLLFEDAAIAAGILLAGEGLIGAPLAMAAVAAGIAGGDLLLYAFGAAVRRLRPFRLSVAQACISGRVRLLLNGHLATAVLTARVVPGLRLAVYTACGLLAIPFLPFALLVLAAVTLWTGVLFWLGSAAGVLFTQHWQMAPWQAGALVFCLVTILPLLAGRMAVATRSFRR